MFLVSFIRKIFIKRKRCHKLKIYRQTDEAILRVFLDNLEAPYFKKFSPTSCPSMLGPVGDTVTYTISSHPSHFKLFGYP